MNKSRSRWGIALARICQFYYALADAFAVCDQNYCSAMTSTTPNRLSFWTGTVRDEQDAASRVFMRNDQIMIGGQRWKTFPERLQEAGVSWKFPRLRGAAVAG